MRRLTLAALVLAASLAPAAAHAQFAGKWNFEMGQWQSEDGGNLEIRSSSSAVLDVQVKGDSATATWTTPQPGPPLELRGAIAGGKLVLKGQREARVNVNGEESTVTMIITLELDAPAGGEVSGVMRMTGGPGGGARRTGKGKKA